MKVVDNRCSQTKLRFEDLLIGDAYLDEDDNLCIKTNKDYENTNCMRYNSHKIMWEADFEYNYSVIRPIEMVYTIEG